jgi:hypothetical protein
MATKRYSALDLQRIPLQGLRLENLSAAPASPQAGDAYFDTVLGYARIWNGSTWEHAGDPVIADGSLSLAKLATNPLARANHTGTQAASTISDFAATVEADAVALRLDQFAVPTAPVDLGGQRATDAADPAAPTDLTTQQWVEGYVLSRVNGLDWKPSARVMATTNVSVTAAPAAIDGVTLTTGDRVLLSGQSAGAENGLWVYATAGNPMTRAADADAGAEVSAGLTVFVAEGTVGHDTIWSLATNDTVTVGTTALTFQQIGSGTAYSVTTPVTLTGTTIGLDTVPVAKGGTGAITDAAARTALNVPQRGFVSDVPALTAGVGPTLAHGLGTNDLVVQVRLKSTGQVYEFDITMDATNVTITSALATTAAQFRLTAIPVA